MRRTLLVLSVAAAVCLPTTRALAQTAPQFAQTAAFVARLQNEDGGFAPKPGAPSTLGATNSALKVLRFMGGSVPDVPGCARFVKSCRVPGSGFSQAPGGKPDVATTAVGLMAASELKLVDPSMIEEAMTYFHDHANAFEEVRMAIAGMEAAKAKSPDFPRWAKQLEAMRNSEGSFGEGDSRAFTTGGVAAGILRMGLPLERREAVLAAIKAGQRPEGAWAKDSGATDLGSSYRVMRALYMMKEKPDIERILGFIASCRQPDGSYSTRPGGQGDLGSTYSAAIIIHWIRELEGMPAVPSSSDPITLFNGIDLTGWEGNAALWSARDGMLVGTSPGLDHNEFLATRQKYRDFELSLKFRLVDGKGNSGVQFRSVRVPGTEMSGYQADLGENYWACLYDESRRNKVLVKADPTALATLKKDGWNDYVIRAVGDKITLKLNGVNSVEYHEDDPSVGRDGLIAVQIHAGAPMEVQFKDIHVRDLSSAPGSSVKP